jgi:hypothetical protein
LNRFRDIVIVPLILYRVSDFLALLLLFDLPLFLNFSKRCFFFFCYCIRTGGTAIWTFIPGLLGGDPKRTFHVKEFFGLAAGHDCIYFYFISAVESWRRQWESNKLEPPIVAWTTIRIQGPLTTTSLCISFHY